MARIRFADRDADAIDGFEAQSLGTVPAAIVFG